MIHVLETRTGLILAKDFFATHSGSNEGEYRLGSRWPTFTHCAFLLYETLFESGPSHTPSYPDFFFFPFPVFLGFTPWRVPSSPTRHLNFSST
jgi:hypothetical protein